MVEHKRAAADPAPKGVDLETKARLRHDALEAWMQAQPDRDTLLAKLADAGIACAPVTSMHAALTGPIARERDLLVAVDDRRGGTRSVVRPPARFSVSSNRVRGPAPRLGEHITSVLADLLGYDADRVAALEASGVLRREL